jgi:hypothetical protein
MGDILANPVDLQRFFWEISRLPWLKASYWFHRKNNCATCLEKVVLMHWICPSPQF